MYPSGEKSGFTLIELLVVIAIIAILAVVVVLTLNPAQLLAQSRDANRVSDLATINSAINLYSTDQAGASTYSLGTASTTYLSVPSASSSCATLGMASSAYPYYCSTSANYRLASSTGWLPINFNLISSGAPFGSVPVDPTNQTSSGLYYTYNTNGSTYDISAFPESQKYAKNAFNDGGNDPVLLEAGSGMATLPDAGRGLVGYWPLNEGNGSTTIDWSGEGNNGTITGAVWTSGKTSANALQFYGGSYLSATSSYITIGSSSILDPSIFTVSGWIDLTTSTNGYNYIYSNTRDCCETDNGFDLEVNGQTPFAKIANGGSVNNFSGGTVPLNTWTMVTATYNGATVVIYVNGAQVYSGAYAGGVGKPATYSDTLGALAYNPGMFSTVGSIDDVRLYDRALSAAEVAEMYNAEK